MDEAGLHDELPALTGGMVHAMFGRRLSPWVLAPQAGLAVIGFITGRGRRRLGSE
jgi:hypothetical protein